MHDTARGKILKQSDQMEAGEVRTEERKEMKRIKEE